MSFAISGSLLAISAATPSIGFVKSAGEFRVDGSAVRGNGTVFEGALVETSGSRSVIQLAGVQITLAPDSRVRVYHDRTVLEKGGESVKGGEGHMVEAATLRIAPFEPDSVIQIDYTAPMRVTVSATGGRAEVRNSAGVLTASVRPGVALAFEPQAAASAAAKLTGVIEVRGHQYFLTDETSKVTVQLQDSADVVKYAGKRVLVTGSALPGSTPGAGASQVIRPVTIQLLGNLKKGAGAAGAAGGIAGAGGAAVPGGAAAGAGISSTAVVAIVGGVAVAGTVGGLAAVGSFDSTAPVSAK